MKKFVLLTSTFFLLALSTASARTYSKTEVRTFDISPNGKVVVDNVNGAIKVESWDKDQVMLQATKTVRAGDQEEADEYLDRLRIEIDNEKDYLEVRTHYPHEGWGGFWDWLFHGGSRYAGVEYVLKVPKSVNLEVETTNGNVDVSSVAGGVKAGSTNGQVNLNDVGRSVDGSTTNGDISASISDEVEFRDLKLTTTNGSINVSCPENINADVSAHTTNGNISSEFPVTIQGSFNNKSFEGQINKGGSHIYLHTTNGSIEINKR
ncbi:MAG TPA: DUF4097 family beta strand repeat-containing protein [Candidatus Acidoferrales bacterium]|nr:DUF4097 family beta strand repeat-containing protein [Candidatus Acidoferrales bacterium]